MTKLFEFLNRQMPSDFSFEEEDKGFLTVLNEHSEIKTLLERRHLYPETLTINGVNPIFHVLIEGIIENQLHSQADVQEVYTKLQKEENLTPHAARACIANVFLHDYYKVLSEHKPFDQESFVRRLSLIGTDISNIGRNDHCPCGSGAKYKRCCSLYAEAFIVSPLAGRIDLGYGAYFFETPKNILDPLNPIFQLEARNHIAMYMDSHQDLDGAIKVLKENLTLVESYEGGRFSENAWQDYMLFCKNYEQLAQEFVGAADHLISMADNDAEKGTMICDKADFLAQKGNLETAEADYTNLFSAIPKFYFGRYRYALMLSINGREDDAIKYLTDLLNIKEIDYQTHEQAYTLLEYLGGDTSSFKHRY
ncbi:SEC-C motif domain protein [Candidatus Desulfosporosinus infrequens]|uniref:SEC-C motif domain protein n=1 Tax=Candidatus Desulfosporosinus infrequens TaxID=2043169 RepID=A0A2U3L3A6_9FIRM|nr:SEC-C motif domain protein [Candidatus Desulfosporosinus infrequens]